MGVALRLANRLAGYVKPERGDSNETMPHFTVVPVKDQAQSSYDSLEGINCVDYRDTGQDCPDHQDTVSIDGEPHNFFFPTLLLIPNLERSAF